MSQVEVRIEGLRELDRKLRRLEGRVARKIVRDATRKGAQALRKEIRAAAPRRTGFLRRHIRYRTTSRSPTHYTISVGPDRGAFYGRFVELGTQKMAARPFMRPAFERARERIVRIVTDRLREGIERAARG